MKRFRNKVLYISSEEMFERIRKILTENNQFVATDGTYCYFGDGNPFNYLCYAQSDGDWFTSVKAKKRDEEITEEEFINLLNKDDDN